MAQLGSQSWANTLARNLVKERKSIFNEQIYYSYRKYPLSKLSLGNLQLIISPFISSLTLALSTMLCVSLPDLVLVWSWSVQNMDSGGGSYNTTNTWNHNYTLGKKVYWIYRKSRKYTLYKVRVSKVLPCVQNINPILKPTKVKIHQLIFPRLGQFTNIFIV